MRHGYNGASGLNWDSKTAINPTGTPFKKMHPQPIPKMQQAVLPRTKVCGITRESDLEYLNASGVEAVGLNLVPSSKRFLGLDSAIRLAARAAELELETVAVVMNPTPSQLELIVKAFSWSLIQFHGHETPAMAEACGGIAIIKAVSWSGRPEEQAIVDNWSKQFGGSLESKENATSNGCFKLAGFLLDAYAPGQSGGTGQKARWDLIYPRPKSLQNWPVMLAGGLTADNVFAAVQATRCEGVDVASGVESSPGIKSAELVQRFAAAANQGFASF
jgi:phosphoribosylanthranilate isomerase